MKVFALIGIILAPVASVVCFVYMIAVEEFKSQMAYESAYYDSDIVLRETERTLLNVHSAIGTITLILMVFYIVLYSISMRKVQNKVVKTIGVIGIILSVFMICWDFVMMGAPLAISFDEVGMAWFVYFLTCTAFSIVMLIQYNRNIKVKKVLYKENVLDDLEFE